MIDYLQQEYRIPFSFMDLDYLGTLQPTHFCLWYRGTYNVFAMRRYLFKPDSLSKSTFEQNNQIPFLQIQNLASGNVISLLPDALCFEVICEGTLTLEEASTPKEISTEDFPSADTNEKAKANSKESSGTKSYSTLP